MRTRQVHLVSYPDGMVQEGNFAVVDAPLRGLKYGEVLLACQWQSNLPHFGQSKFPQVNRVISRH
jgi:NADPH-dependent curcumin reductase CurA